MDSSHSHKQSHDHISQAYLIRFWRGSPDEPWRALAKQVADGREIYFAGPEELFLFYASKSTKKAGGRRPRHRRQWHLIEDWTISRKEEKE